MSIPPFIVRFNSGLSSPSEDAQLYGVPYIRRVVGAVEMRHLLPLFHTKTLEPNPRSARRNRVTSDIIDTLKRNAELFQFKSKGILLGTADFAELQRNRYRLSFGDPSIEGILDGGHNMLAIGLFLIEDLVNERVFKQTRSWDDLMGVWPSIADKIAGKKDVLSVPVPVELLLPSDPDDEDAVANFHSALIEICRARNNNAQLPQEAAANKVGYYDGIKERLPESFRNRVEWRPNTWEDTEEERPIQVRDLLALAWIPLNLLSKHKALPKEISVSPQDIYRNKGECSKRFEELMQMVTIEKEASRRELDHPGVESAFEILADLPELYDQIYEEFPDAYNTHGKRFRANTMVKIYDPEARDQALAQGRDVTGYIAAQPTTPFMRRPVRAANGSKPCSYPEGLIIPLVYGLQGLMKVTKGKVTWAVSNPRQTVRELLPKIAGVYPLVLEMGKWDPQKIAKNPYSHQFAVEQFRSSLQSM